MHSPTLTPRHLVLLACVLGAALFSPARAEEAAIAPAVTVSDAWARWLPGGLPCAGYMILHNTGSTDVALTGADCPAFGHVMLHESFTTKNGENRMRHVDRLPIPAGGQVELRPGGYHLMLMRPQQGLKPGDTVKVTLHFAGGGTLAVTLPVKPAGTTE